jgi:hypothetical protein
MFIYWQNRTLLRFLTVMRFFLEELSDKCYRLMKRYTCAALGLATYRIFRAIHVLALVFRGTFAKFQRNT